MTSTPRTVEADPADPADPAGRLGAELPAAAVGPAARVAWGGWAEVRADRRQLLRVTLLVALAGLPVGGLWWLLAPRVEFLVTDAGPEPVGDFSAEFRVADDGVLALLLLGLGLLAGLATWVLSPRRGVGDVLALAAGGSLAAVLAWQLGEALGRGPTEAEATEGARLTTALELAALPALALAPFAALLVYLAAAVLIRDDGLGRSALSSPSSGSRTGAAAPAPPPAPGAG